MRVLASAGGGSSGAGAGSPRAAFRWRRPLKYVEVAKTTLQHNLAYALDVTWRSIFLIFIVFIFTQLWKKVFSTMPGSSVEGYDLHRMIWYFMTAEVLVLSTPPVWRQIGEQVRSGDLAYALSKPYSYVWYHYASFMSEAMLRFFLNFAVGGTFVTLYLGPLQLAAVQPLAFFAAVVGSFSLHYLILVIIGLSAFWVEEPTPYHFIYQKLVFILGGMLLPIEVLPDSFERLAAWLPLKSIIHGPARLLARFESTDVAAVFAAQAGWIAVLACAALAVYRTGVKRVHVNGG